MLDGLASRGLARDAGAGVVGIVDFPDVVQAANMAADEEFSLSAAVL